MSHEAITSLTFHADLFRLKFNITVFLSNLPHGLFISPHGLFIHQKKLTVKVSYTSITAGTLSCCKYLSAAFQAQFCLHHSAFQAFEFKKDVFGMSLHSSQLMQGIHN